MNEEEYEDYINELRLHGTRELAEEVYRLEQKIERLKEENKILKDALLFIWKDYKVDEIDIEELKRALKELKGSDKEN